MASSGTRPLGGRNCIILPFATLNSERVFGPQTWRSTPRAAGRRGNGLRRDAAATGTISRSLLGSQAEEQDADEGENEQQDERLAAGIPHLG